MTIDQNTLLTSYKNEVIPRHVAGSGFANAIGAEAQPDATAWAIAILQLDTKSTSMLESARGLSCLASIG